MSGTITYAATPTRTYDYDNGLTTTNTFMGTLVTRKYTVISDKILPTSLACDTDFMGNVDQAVGAGPVNNNTWPQILHCCGDSEITIWQDDPGCTAWCEPSSLAYLHDLVTCYTQPNGTLAPGFDTLECDASWEGNVTVTPSCGFGPGTATMPPLSQSDSDSTISATATSTTHSATPSTHTGGAAFPKALQFGKMEIAVTTLMLSSLLAGIIL